MERALLKAALESPWRRDDWLLQVAGFVCGISTAAFGFVIHGTAAGTALRPVWLLGIGAVVSMGLLRGCTGTATVVAALIAGLTTLVTVAVVTFVLGLWLIVDLLTCPPFWCSA